jgi:diadenosine tetraphosphate (Ap4A) HIT family hydrolase
VLETDWSLHPQLRDDTVAVGDLALSRLLAMNDADFPWLLLVPRRVGVSEIIDLGPERAMLMDEIARASRALKDETRCDKLNVAAIGNITFTSSRAARTTRCGRSWSGARHDAPVRRPR